MDGTLEGFLGEDRLADLLYGVSAAEAALLRDRGKVADMAVLAKGWGGWLLVEGVRISWGMLP